MSANELSEVAVDLQRLVKSCKYWQGTAECECQSSLPKGGCLRCDMEQVVNLITQIIRANNGHTQMSEERTNAGLLSSDLFAGFDPDECDLIVMDGYDDCIVGVVERYGQGPILCYDKEKVLCRLEADGMDRDEAEEFFLFQPDRRVDG